MSDHEDLPDELAAELAALPPFASVDAAVAVVNGDVRGRYMRRLSELAATNKLSDPLVHRIGAALNSQCDRVIALIAVATTPPGSACTYPLSSLTSEERRGLL
jgi:hypothetical protein